MLLVPVTGCSPGGRGHVQRDHPSRREGSEDSAAWPQAIVRPPQRDRKDRGLRHRPDCHQAPPNAPHRPAHYATGQLDRVTDSYQLPQFRLGRGISPRGVGPYIRFCSFPTLVTLPASGGLVFPAVSPAIPNEFVSRIAAFPQARRSNTPGRALARIRCSAYSPDVPRRVCLLVSLSVGVSGGGAFWGCDVPVHRRRGFHASVGGRRRRDAGSRPLASC